MKMLRYIERAELCAWICLAFGYGFTSSETGESYTLAEIRAMSS